MPCFGRGEVGKRSKAEVRTSTAHWKYLVLRFVQTWEIQGEINTRFALSGNVPTYLSPEPSAEIETDKPGRVSKPSDRKAHW